MLRGFPLLGGVTFVFAVGKTRSRVLRLPLPPCFTVPFRLPELAQGFLLLEGMPERPLEVSQEVVWR